VNPPERLEGEVFCHRGIANDANNPAIHLCLKLPEQCLKGFGISLPEAFEQFHAAFLLGLTGAVSICYRSRRPIAADDVRTGTPEEVFWSQSNRAPFGSASAVVTRTVFTDLQLAGVGLTEDQQMEQLGMGACRTISLEGGLRLRLAVDGLRKHSLAGLERRVIGERWCLGGPSPIARRCRTL
jgi:hypothetical protein